MSVHTLLYLRLYPSSLVSLSCTAAQTKSGHRQCFNCALREQHCHRPPRHDSISKVCVLHGRASCHVSQAFRVRARAWNYYETPENNENLNAISAFGCFIYVEQVRHIVYRPAGDTNYLLFRLEVLKTSLVNLTHTWSTCGIPMLARRAAAIK